MSIEVVAWGEKCEKRKDFLYTMQATVKGKRELNRLSKEVPEWKSAGQGFDPNTEETIILLKCRFPEKKDWVAFAKTLSFPVHELSSRTGKKRTINGKRKNKRG